MTNREYMNKLNTLISKETMLKRCLDIYTDSSKRSEIFYMLEIVQNEIKLLKFKQKINKELKK